VLDPTQVCVPSTHDPETGVEEEVDDVDEATGGVTGVGAGVTGVGAGVGTGVGAGVGVDGVEIEATQ